MIKAHGSACLNPRYLEEGARRDAILAEAEELPSLLLNSAAAANAVMLGAGYFSPLDGFMDLPDALLVAGKMRTAAGLFWPIPVLNLSTNAGPIDGASRIALRDPNRPGQPVLAVQDIESVALIEEEDFDFITECVYGTLDEEHPGVRTFRRLGRHLVAGPIEVLNYSYFEEDFSGTFRSAGSIRAEIAERGWKKVVAFQTRNPMHRAHEELCKMAQESTGADGVLIHMLLGRLKAGDIPASVREEAIRCMVDRYFPSNSVMVAGYGFDMLYAGPREAVLHAISDRTRAAPISSSGGITRESVTSTVPSMPRRSSTKKSPPAPSRSTSTGVTTRRGPESSTGWWRWARCGITAPTTSFFCPAPRFARC